MTATADPGDISVDVDEINAHEAGFPEGFEGRLLFWIAVAFSVFQIATAAHLVNLPSQIVRAVHVGFLGLLGFPFLALAHRKGPTVKTLAWALALVGVAIAAYQWVEYGPLILRSGDPTQLDTLVGVALLVVVFAGAWIIMGPALPIIAALFLAYDFFGQYLPSPLQTRGYDFGQVIDQMSFGTEGIYGIPVYVSSSYIFLFILFGVFPGARRDDPAVHRCLARHGRPQAGRGGEGGGGLLRSDGHDLGLWRGQCGDHRAVHHSADEELWLSLRLCRRGRGDGLAWAGRSCRR